MYIVFTHGTFDWLWNRIQLVPFSLKHSFSIRIVWLFCVVMIVFHFAVNYFFKIVFTLCTLEFETKISLSHFPSVCFFFFQIESYSSFVCNHVSMTAFSLIKVTESYGWLKIGPHQNQKHSCWFLEKHKSILNINANNVPDVTLCQILACHWRCVDLDMHSCTHAYREPV